MTTVRLPAFLRASSGLGSAGLGEVVEVPSGSLLDVLDALDGVTGVDVAALLLDEAGLRRGVNVYVGSADVRYGAGLATVVADDDVVTILPAVDGVRA